MVAGSDVRVQVLQGLGGTKAYLDLLLRPIARPSIKASNNRTTARMAMQVIFLLKPKYFLWPGIRRSKMMNALSLTLGFWPV